MACVCWTQPGLSNETTKVTLRRSERSETVHQCDPLRFPRLTTAFTAASMDAPPATTEAEATGGSEVTIPFQVFRVVLDNALLGNVPLLSLASCVCREWRVMVSEAANWRRITLLPRKLTQEHLVEVIARADGQLERIDFFFEEPPRHSWSDPERVPIFWHGGKITGEGLAEALSTQPHLKRFSVAGSYGLSAADVLKSLHPEAELEDLLVDGVQSSGDCEADLAQLHARLSDGGVLDVNGVCCGEDGAGCGRLVVYCDDEEVDPDDDPEQWGAVCCKCENQMCRFCYVLDDSNFFFCACSGHVCPKCMEPLRIDTDYHWCDQCEQKYCQECVDAGTTLPFVDCESAKCHKHLCNPRSMEMGCWLKNCSFQCSDCKRVLCATCFRGPWQGRPKSPIKQCPRCRPAPAAAAGAAAAS